MFKRRAAIGVCALLMISLLAVSAAAEDAKVTLIEVQGNKRIETATILAKIKTKEGGIFSPMQIKEDIKVLYQLGHFEDVQVKTEGFENGLKVIFLVKEKPLIREITFEGNDALTTEKLKEGLTLLPRTAFNLQLIQENAEKIRLKYQDDGYYDAIVVPVITELRGGDRNVIFNIKEGGKVKLKENIITGNKALTSDEIKKALKTQEHWFFSFLGRSGTLRTEELREDLENIRNLYYNKGYIQVQVDEPVIEPKTYKERVSWFSSKTRTITKKDELVVRINIKEGEQFRVGSLTFKGNASITTRELENEAKLKPGDVFSREVLRQDVARIMDRYDGIAKPFASVIPLFNIDPEKKTVAINIEIQEGGEVRIGRINISGNSKTRDKVIRREMRLDEGDLYSKKALKRSYDRINNLNFFESVDIVPERRQQEPVMDLDVKVKEKMTGTLSLGGGYSSVDKLMGIVEVTQGNLGGRGQLLKLKTQWGGTHRIVMLSFMEPYLFDEPIWGRVDIYRQEQTYDGYTLLTTGFGLGTGKSFGEYLSGSIRYSLDQSQAKNITVTPIPFALQQQLENYGTVITTSAVTASLTRDSRDFYLDPKTGSRNTMFVEYAGGPLGGDPEFIKSVADSAWYFPLPFDTVFMARGRIGYVVSLIDKPIPIGERFFVGGSGSVRGFRYGTAGPVDNFGNRVGGNKELIFNFEYNFPIVPAARLKGVFFYDMGRGFDDNLLVSEQPDEPTKISIRELRQTWGFGFWWLSPIGPLRFEWGFIIDKKPTDQPSKFEFNIGTLF
ncbi:MAG TPA: outer membrane protein assembly factor BamA [Nitrospirota bacterium]|nr:outer membrane protein assembly factor BamA [Nitrospirota bacterium]